MESGKIQSILRRKEEAENAILSRQEEGLEERKEKIMPKVKEQFEQYENLHPIITKAEELLETHGIRSQIPVEELENSDFDDARLLAFCELIEKSKQRTLH